jgi:hypothetical protein
MVIMMEVEHGFWQPSQSGLAVRFVEFLVNEALPVQTCSQKFTETPREALASRV